MRNTSDETGFSGKPAIKNSREWFERINALDFAFQPIVNIHTGLCYGLEALLRNYAEAGFSNIQEVFDKAYEDGMLFTLDLVLRNKVMKKFTRLEFHDKTKLFYNIDNRVLFAPDYSPAKVQNVMERFQLTAGTFCFEVSERQDVETYHEHDFKNINEIKSALNYYRQDLYKIAIDDYGSGLSGLKLLYHSDPDYVKIDRFFISGIENDARKRLFVSTTLNMARILGITVIAEGVETKEEYYICKEIGCDYVQGYLIQRPTQSTSELCKRYEIVTELNRQNRREYGSDHKLIYDNMQYIDPIPIHKEQHTYTEMATVFEKFRTHKSDTFFPVTNGNAEPLGIIRERDLKEYVYSPYGRDILMNKSCGNILNFITRIPISEVNIRVERVLELFATNDQSEGILFTEDGKYVGFLGANSLLRIINEKNIAEARDQNPLSRLPGNTLINQYISESLADTMNKHVFVYFDFNNFKPFNDKFGFRQGDRAILLFADILKGLSNTTKVFIGHIGGDDFFVGFNLKETEESLILPAVKEVLDRFTDNVQSLYSMEDRERGFYQSFDREGNERMYPLVCASAGMLIIPAGELYCSTEDVFTMLAELKKQAKQSPEKYSIKILRNTPDN